MNLVATFFCCATRFSMHRSVRYLACANKTPPNAHTFIATFSHSVCTHLRTAATFRPAPARFQQSERSCLPGRFRLIPTRNHTRTTSDVSTVNACVSISCRDSLLGLAPSAATPCAWVRVWPAHSGAACISLGALQCRPRIHCEINWASEPTSWAPDSCFHSIVGGRASAALRPARVDSGQTSGIPTPHRRLLSFASIDLSIYRVLACWRGSDVRHTWESADCHYQDRDACHYHPHIHPPLPLHHPQVHSYFEPRQATRTLAISAVSSPPTLLHHISKAFRLSVDDTNNPLTLL
jgi:hypothetical protein